MLKSTIKNVLCKLKSTCSKIFLTQAPKGKSQWSTIQRGSSYMRIQFLPAGNLFVLIITNKVVIKKKRCLNRLQSNLFNADSKGTWPSVHSPPPGFRPRLSCCFLRQGTLHFVSFHPGVKMGTGTYCWGVILGWTSILSRREYQYS